MEEQKMAENNLRQPIVTLCGHVDHGKTSVLDCLRESAIQDSESGGITQKISFTSYTADQLKRACPLIEKQSINLDIPGFLLIDTPGHAAFTNLRKRGGSLADLAVLVVDINDGIKPQTAEVLKILKHNKVPFVIALNKIDNISGWRSPDSNDTPLKKSIDSQKTPVKNDFDQKYMTLISSLQSYGLDADLYYNISDFSKKVALVPTSAETKQGIPELIMMLCGLSQRYLENKLELGDKAKGVVLETKKEKSIPYVEAILYDGELKNSDSIALSNLEGDPFISRIRVLEEIRPLSTKFDTSEKVRAATGMRMQLIEKSDVLPGMPFEVYENNKEEIEKKFKEEISENINSYLSKQGVIAKADSLGSLEALLYLLKENDIPVVKADIGDINKTDIISAKANVEINEVDAAVVGFNVSVSEDAKSLAKEQGDGIKIITDDVVYKLIENTSEFRQEKAKEIQKRRLMELSTIGKAKVLHKFVFRNTNPAIFGVSVEGGKIQKGLQLISERGEKIGKIKGIQSQNEAVNQASTGMDVAISIPNINFERFMKDKEYVYTDISESQFRKFKEHKDLLSQEEIKILQEIAEVKRIDNPDWGQ
ncbi:MAG: translation initiation factor IF-2 [Candidatus Pacearchaeota archaeon]